ncbi:disease resistance protein At4g27190-like [Telopea speciosissima]|uniref:disease resistance protein At4g27190-like n=1 Tax=Telopea speciosissima TaxID=54955 RepID=UPI001CC4B815|nr:disease resistance protein At4g27190-like [Telopea speciosissima]
MDIVVGVAIGAITEVVKYFVSPFTRRISYLVHHKRNANDLRNQIARLGKVKEDVQSFVNAAHMRGEVIRVVVEGWLIKVNQMQSKEMELQNALEESKGCLQGGCSGRYQVGKNAKHMIDEVKELLNEGGTFAAVSDPSPLPPSIESMQTLDFQEFGSTKSAMDQIMKALKDEDINMVGVYGMAGVGKTTLMKEVAKILKKDGLFDQVMMVTVSQDPVLTKLQGEIAENLGLPLTQASLSVRARFLLDSLKEKRILLVLDDLWEQLNLLEELGIPCGNNCKVVLTTRRLEVCNQMKTQSNVEVKVLSEGDAWVLFKSVVGERIEEDNMLCSVANQVVRECGGLPLIVVVIGSTLRDKDLSTWEDAASELKKSSSSPPDIEGLHKKVFCPIKWSYDFLDNDATKFCFLLCCLFPEDSIISEEDLLPYVVGERVFGNIHTLTEARKRLHTQMERLKRSCLLLDDHKKEGCVRMHDVIQDVSIWIASSEGHDFVVVSGRPLTNWPDGETLRKCKRLSLMRCEIKKLPNWLDCSQLMTLSLRDNKWLWEIPDGFFQGMISLKTLDLINTFYVSIPSSLSCLTNLRALRISGNQGTFDVSLLGKLKNLEILHLPRCSGLQLLPEEIGELTNLKLLDLSNNQNLIIAPNTLMRLSLLEELDLKKSFHEWEIEEDDRIRSKNCCLYEVGSLSALTKLKIRASNIKCLCAKNNNNNIPFHWENLTSFEVIVGIKDWKYVQHEVKACARWVVFSGAIIPNSLSDWMRWIIFLLERTEGLQLQECRGLKYGLSSLIGADSGAGARALNNLRILFVKDCGYVEYLLSTNVVD